MENPPTEPSPLAAFPNEHPTPPPSMHRPFYTSRLAIAGIFILILLTVGIYGGNMYLNQEKTPASQMAQETPLATPTPTITAPTPMAVTANWNSYKNASYAYEVKYATNTTNKEANTAQYGYTEFQNGCFKVYAVPKGTEESLTEKENDIPWKQLDDLKSLRVGEKRNCSVLTFTFGSDNKAIVNRNNYTRLESKKIANHNWYAFEVDNPVNPGATHNVYFLEKDTYTYVIDMFTGGSCPATTASDMLTTFAFTATNICNGLSEKACLENPKCVRKNGPSCPTCTDMKYIECIQK